MTKIFLCAMLFSVILLKPSEPSYLATRQCLSIITATSILPSLGYPRIFYVEEPQRTSTTTTTKPPDTPETIRRRIWIECVDKTDVDSELVVMLKSGSQDAWNKRNEELKKWGLCVLVQKGLMSKEGVFKMDVARSMIQKKYLMQFAEKVIDDCLSKTAMPPEDIAWNYLTCHNKMTRRAKSSNISAISIY